jgi:hypothetical protein
MRSVWKQHLSTKQSYCLDADHGQCRQKPDTIIFQKGLFNYRNTYTCIDVYSSPDIIMTDCSSSQFLQNYCTAQCIINVVIEYYLGVTLCANCLV